MTQSSEEPSVVLGWKERAAAILFEQLLRGAARLPLGVSQKLGRGLGNLLYWLDSRAAKVTAINLDACHVMTPGIDRDQLIRQSLRHTGQTIMETPAVWLGQPQRIRSWITAVENDSVLDATRGPGQGMIIVLPHFGNWELLNAYYADRESLTALYHPPTQAFLQPIMAKVRENNGHELVPTNKRGIARLYRSLAEGRVIVILPDQVPASGDFVDFFGLPAFTDRLISRLVQKTGAKVVSSIFIRNADHPGFTARFAEADQAIYSGDLKESMRGVNRTVENCVAADPAQYQWEYKRFRVSPPDTTPLY
ncbi:MAG: KDO2-lipid IV(A) lauroyltransferase [Porticoccaceae bacterium]